MDTEIVVSAEVTEVVFTDATELALTEDNFEVLVDADSEVVISQEAIEILALEAAPDWVWQTRVFVQNTPPINPRLGDVWIVRA